MNQKLSFKFNRKKSIHPSPAYRENKNQLSSMIRFNYNSLLLRQILVRKDITTRKQLIAVNVNELIPAQTLAANSLEGLKR